VACTSRPTGSEGIGDGIWEKAIIRERHLNGVYIENCHGNNPKNIVNAPLFV
jgi:hypothetical protein